MEHGAWGELARSLSGLRAAFDESYEATHGFLPESPAGEECRRDDLGGAWGDTPARDPNIMPLTSVFVLLDHMGSLSTLLTSPGGITATHTLARAMLDISTGPWFLLEPGIDGRERVRRHMNLRLQSLKEQTHLETGTDRTAIKVQAEGRIQRIVQAARAHGFDVRRTSDRYQPPFLGTKLPTTTALATQMIDPALGQLLWRIGSAVAHGQQHGISMFLEQIDQPVDPLHGDAAAQMGASAEATALRCGGGPLAVICTLQRLFLQFGWDTTRLSIATADVVNTWQSVAGVRRGPVPESLRGSSRSVMQGRL
ncbi:hypothetical protein [Streptomyces sp. CS147]|uniref:hypothetical protein n=1 Tax=Streptomyces sp. CS147 TaxID=2162715 RepID=UPI000D50B882|nr:hypothetical protein [Streptomyces sp. CS147]PVD10119.1 hypothetical protein DBP21_00040 [Streptomyces sp. CS147]